MALADLVVVMNKGKVEDQGKPERVYLQPATIFSAGFMGASNFLDGTVRRATVKSMEIETTIGRLTLLAPRGLTAGQSVILSMRPEHFASPAKGLLDLGEISIEEAGFFGTHHVARGRHLRDPGFVASVHVAQDDVPRLGAKLRLAIDPAKIVVLAKP
jgi:spermidine/putrescine transport system ATP-binding protein